MPDSLLHLLSRIDPDSTDFQSTQGANPFLGKKILVCHGDKDDLVPWEAGKKFVDGLEVGPTGRKKVVLEPDRGHEASALMIQELARWIAEYGMARETANANNKL